jgi:hypothetical protein
MKAFRHSTKESLLKSWPRSSGRATIGETVFKYMYAYIGKVFLKSSSQELKDQKS